MEMGHTSLPIVRELGTAFANSKERFAKASDTSDKLLDSVKDAKEKSNQRKAASLLDAETRRKEALRAAQAKFARETDRQNAFFSKAKADSHSRFAAAESKALRDYDAVAAKSRDAIARAKQARKEQLGWLDKRYGEINPRMRQKAAKAVTAAVPEPPDFSLIQNRLEKVNDDSLWAKIKALLQIDGFTSRKAMTVDLMQRIANARLYIDNECTAAITTASLKLEEAERIKTTAIDAALHAQESEAHAAILKQKSAMEHAARVRADEEAFAEKSHEASAEQAETDWAATNTAFSTKVSEITAQAKTLLEEANRQTVEEYRKLGLEQLVTDLKSDYFKLGCVRNVWQDDFTECLNPDWRVPIAKCRIKVGIADPAKEYVTSTLGSFVESENIIRDIMFDDVTAPHPLWLEYGASKQEVMEAIQFMLAARLRSMPLGSLKILVLDPYDMGTNVGKLNALTNPADGGDPVVIERVATLQRDVDEVIRSVRSFLDENGTKVASYKNQSLREYNEDASNSERLPYITLVVNDIDIAGYSTSALQWLREILVKSMDMGISIIFTCKELSAMEDERSRKPLEDIKGACISGSYDETGFLLEGAHLEFFSMDAIPAAYFVGFIERYREEMRRRSEIVIDADASRFVTVDGRSVEGSRRHIVNANPGRDAGADGTIRIPFGVGRDNSITELTIGRGPDYHALVTGSVGSGKSVLLHALINGIATYYSPDEIELWLVDFKGVEFKQYVHQPLPHIKLIGLTEDEEFAENLLEKIEAEFGKISDEEGHATGGRRKILEDENLRDINEYNAQTTHLPGHPNYMRHVVLIVDEFSVLCSYLKRKAERENAFGRVLKLYRAAGLYCIFANQSIDVGGSKMLSKDVLAQISTRIGLYNADSYQFDQLFNDSWSAAKAKNGLPASPTTLKVGQFVMWNQQRYDFGQSTFYGDSGNNSGLLQAISKAAGEDYGPSSAKVVDERIRERFDMGEFTSSLTAEFDKPADEPRGQVILVGTACSLLVDGFFRHFDFRDCENAIVFGQRDNLRSDIVSAIMASYTVYGKPVTLVSADRSACDKRLCEAAAAMNAVVKKDLDSFSGLVLELANQIDSSKFAQQLVVLNGASDMIGNGVFPTVDVLPTAASAENPAVRISATTEQSEYDSAMSAINAFASQASRPSLNPGDIRARIQSRLDSISGDTAADEKASSDVSSSAAEKEIAPQVSNDIPGRADSSGISLTNATLSELLLKVMKYGPRFGIHIVWNERDLPDFSEMFPRSHIWPMHAARVLFRHRFATVTDNERALLELGFANAREWQAHGGKAIIACYSDAEGNTARFRPFEMPW